MVSMWLHGYEENILSWNINPSYDLDYVDLRREVYLTTTMQLSEVKVEKQTKKR